MFYALYAKAQKRCFACKYKVFWGLYAHFRGNTAPGNPRPPAAVNARFDRLVASQPPLARAMSTDAPDGTVGTAGHRKTPRIITIKNFQSSPKYLELAIRQLNRKKTILDRTNFKLTRYISRLDFQLSRERNLNKGNGI